jgi:hypothetical protein
VDGCGCRARHVEGISTDTFFAVAAVDVGVAGLPRGFVDWVRAEGVGCGCGSWREGFGAEFGGGILVGDDLAGLVLEEEVSGCGGEEERERDIRRWLLVVQCRLYVGALRLGRW